jgi:hypothetical protein
MEDLYKNYTCDRDSLRGKHIRLREFLDRNELAHLALCQILNIDPDPFIEKRAMELVGEE